MDHDLEQQLRARIAELEKENQKLLRSVHVLEALRKEYLDLLIGPVREEDLPTEEQFAEMMKEPRYPAEQVFKELGIPFGDAQS